MVKTIVNLFMGRNLKHSASYNPFGRMTFGQLLFILLCVHYLNCLFQVLYDIGVVSRKEPFQCVINQGIILGEVSKCVLAKVIHFILANCLLFLIAG